MKKIESRDFSKYFSGVRLYKDDIEHIISILKKDELNVSISDDEFEYESLNELVDKRGKRPRKINIDGKRTCSIIMTRICISDANASLYGDRCSTTYELSELLEKKVMRRYNFFNSYFWFIVFLFGCMVISATFKASSDPSKYPEWPVYVLYIASALSIFSLVYRRIDFGVNLAPLHGASFWHRNSDQLILLALGSTPLWQDS